MPLNIANTEAPITRHAQTLVTPEPDGHLPNVFWYGERGIINAVVAHISTSGNFIGSHQEPSQRNMLGNWTPAVLENELSDARLIVEVGLADFGDPDLMMVCRTTC